MVSSGTDILLSRMKVRTTPCAASSSTAAVAAAVCGFTRAPPSSYTHSPTTAHGVEAHLYKTELRAAPQKYQLANLLQFLWFIPPLLATDR